MQNMDDQQYFFEVANESNFLKVEVLKQSYPESEFEWDLKWFDAKISVKGGSFTGEFNAYMQAGEFVNFRQELQILYDTLIGKASFKSLENQVDIQIIGDGIGHLSATCKVKDSEGEELTISESSFLSFKIEFDQTHVPKIMNQLKDIELRFF